MARDPSPISFQTILGAVIPAFVFAAGYVVVFLLIRGTYKSQYSPRTFSALIDEKDRTPSSSKSGTSWFNDYWHLDDKFVLRHHSFDAFLFLRFFKMLMIITILGCLITWPVLFPVNYTGGAGARQLDVISFANVGDAKRCWAHAIIAVIFLSFVVLLIQRERVFTISLRQAYLTTKATSHRLSSRTVLFCAVPAEDLRNGQFSKVFGGDVKRTWKVHQLSDLEGLVDDRKSKVLELEAAELTLAQNVVKHSKHRNGTTNTDSLERAGSHTSNPENRPIRHRHVPLVGPREDAIDSLLEAIPDLSKQIDEIRIQHKHDDERKTGAVFVEFKDQLSAHKALQQIQHHNPLALQPRYIGIPPGNVQWPGVAMNPASRIVKSYTAIALIIAITIFWSIPVGLVTTFSNVTYLADNYSWLHWLHRIPNWLLGLIQGFVPPYLLGLLTSYVPFWFRDIADMSGEPTKQSSMVVVQRWFFVFQFTQVFLVATLASGVTTIITRIGQHPNEVPSFLAENLPKSSNFYLTYFALQGLNSCADQLLKYEDTLEYLFWKMWAKTPRDLYELETSMKGLFYGSNYSKFTVMAIIAIVYATIAPLVLGFAAITFTFYYYTYRYLFLYSNNVKLEMKGTAHARALQQMLVGVYVAELCLIGLFSARGAKGPSTIITILFILTILHHYTLNKYISPLENHIPLDILQRSEDESTDPDMGFGLFDNDDASDNDVENAPLLSSQTSHDGHRATRKHKLNLTRTYSVELPSFLSDPLTSLLEPRFFTPLSILRAYMSDSPCPGPGGHLGGDVPGTIADVPEYTDKQLENAYTNPALTAKAPVVWLARDEMGVSEELKARNKEKADLDTTDEGAILDKHGKVRWDQDDLSKAPIFKKGTKW